MDSGPAGILIFIVLLLFDMMIYGFITACRNLNRKEIERLASEENKKRAVGLWRILNMSPDVVVTLQMIATIMHIILGAFVIAPCRDFVAEKILTFVPEQFVGECAAVLAIVFVLFLICCFGILIPKKIVQSKPEIWAYRFLLPIKLLLYLFKPFTQLSSVTSKGILFLFGMGGNTQETDITEEELISMVQEGHEQGVLQESEAQMISNIFELGDKEVQDIMTHRNNVVAIDGKTGLADAISFMLSGKYSRYPVYDENLDHIIGILHLKDACRYQSANKLKNRPIMELPKLLREPFFVPQTKNVDELFREMQSDKIQMVIVVDEYGQMDGLLAMEDILEEIVGNIQDEYDEDKEYIKEKGEDEYIIEGKTPLEELEERFALSFEDENFETLNGFLISRLDRIPEPNEDFELDYGGYHFRVLSVEKKMIQAVQVTKLSVTDLPEEQTPENQTVMLEQ